VTLGEASGGPILGFNVRAHKEAREAAERAGIEIRYYNIIYDLVDDVKKAMSGLLAPTVRETMLGNATILEIFKVSKVGNVAGCRVTDGVVERGANVRLICDSVVVHEGKLSQLKRFKDDAREVVAGQELRNVMRKRPGYEGRRGTGMLRGGEGETLVVSPILPREFVFTPPPLFPPQDEGRGDRPGKEAHAGQPCPADGISAIPPRAR